jgi:DNA-binding CsgD family transcriptional regulator
VPVVVSALIALDRHTEATELTERFADELIGRDAPAAAAARTLCSAMLAQSRGDLDAAIRAFAHAEEAWRALPRPYEAAIALERRGQCELTRAGTVRARHALTEAWTAYRALGAAWDAGRVRRTLRRHGIEPPHRRGRRGYGNELSPREREVARRAAAGATNREIAVELFLSPKTVEHYVGAAMRKLGVSSRTALPDLANETQKIGGATP